MAFANSRKDERTHPPICRFGNIQSAILILVCMQERLTFMLVYRELKGIKPLSACEVTTKVPIRHIRAFMSCLKLLLIACVWVGFKSIKKKKKKR